MSSGVYDAGITLRGSGPDNSFGTADDTFTPVDILYDKIKATSGSRPLEIYTRGFRIPAITGSRGVSSTPRAIR